MCSKKSINFFQVFLFLILISGCNKTEISNSKRVQYFDFNGFFVKQIDSLNKKHYTLNKTANWEDKVESAELDSPDWKKELLLFLDFNPNSPSMIGLYQCDTLIAPSGETEITLSAKEKNTFCRLARVNINKKGKVELIELMMEKKDALNKMNYTLGYQPMSGFVIQCESLGVTGKSFKMDVLGTFQNINTGY